MERKQRMKRPINRPEPVGVSRRDGYDPRRKGENEECECRESADLRRCTGNADATSTESFNEGDYAQRDKAAGGEAKALGKSCWNVRIVD
jgi:hypothetical protein